MVISSNHGNTYQMDHFDSFLVLIEKTEKIKKRSRISVTRSGDFLDIGQFFKLFRQLL